MAFIATTAPENANGDARAMYARQQARYGYVPNYAKVFCDRPDIMKLWANLLSGIRRNVDPRRFELVTLAAALELGSSYCSLAHAKVLADKFLSEGELRAIAAGDSGTLSAAEVAMMALARKVVADSTSVTREDVDALRENGLSEATPSVSSPTRPTCRWRASSARCSRSAGPSPPRSRSGCDCTESPCAVA
jgi:alkylhydroperoxidase family enzyme